MENIKFLLMAILLIGLSSLDYGQVDRKDELKFSGISESLLNNNLFIGASFRTSDQQLYIYYSNNGINWNTLDKNGSYRAIDSKSNVIRDPSLIFYKNKYWVCYTSHSFAADSGFSIVSTEDLVNWDTVAFVNTTSVQSNDSSRVYGPRFFIDKNDSLFIYVNISDSVHSNFKIYELKCQDNDLKTWSKPLLVNGDFPPNVIDCDLYKIDNKYYMWYTNISVAWTSSIEFATSETRNGNYIVQKSGRWATFDSLSEGSSLVQINDTTWRLYIDSFYGNDVHKMYYAESHDLFQTWTQPIPLEFNYSDVQHLVVTKTNMPSLITDLLVFSPDREKTYNEAITFPYNKMVLDWNGNSVFRFYIDPSKIDNSRNGLSWANAKKDINGVMAELPKDLNNSNVYIFVLPGIITGDQSIIKFNGRIEFYWYGTPMNNDGNSFERWARNGESVSTSYDPITIVGTNTQALYFYGANIRAYFYSHDGNLLSYQPNYAYAERWEFKSDNTPYVICNWNTTNHLVIDYPKISLNTCYGYGIATGGGCDLYLHSPSFYGGTGVASTQTGDSRGAMVFLNFTGIGYVGNTNYNNVFNPSYAPKNNNGIYFKDIKQGVFFNSGGDFIPIIPSSVGYEDENYSYGKTIFQLSTQFSGIINYDSAKVDLIDNSVLSHVVKELSSGLTTQYISNNIISSGSNIILKSLPTTLPNISGALWRDAANGDVIKIVP